MLEERRTRTGRITGSRAARRGMPLLAALASAAALATGTGQAGAATAPATHGVARAWAATAPGGQGNILIADLSNNRIREVQR